MNLLNCRPFPSKSGIKVACLISGGVDSLVAALLLRRKGWLNMVGVFLNNWEEDEEEERCRSQLEKDRSDARFVCERLGIPFKEVNLVKNYWHRVFEEVLEEYVAGRTPNPDILCNERIKFGAFLGHVFEGQDQELRADVVVSGHYAGTSFGPFWEKGSVVGEFNGLENKRVQLLRAKDPERDQTFFLSRVNQDALKRVMFPLKDYLKTEVKQIAIEAGFERIVKRKASTGICFIGKRNFQQFIGNYLQPSPGHFVDVDSGDIVGEHKGFHFWTLGQRVTGISYSRKYFICKKSETNNDIYVASGEDHPLLFSDEFIASNPRWIEVIEPNQLNNNQPMSCLFKFQQKDSLVPCLVFKQSDCKLRVTLYKKERCLTPGQYSVFYDNEQCLGSAVICSVIN